MCVQWRGKERKRDHEVDGQGKPRERGTGREHEPGVRRKNVGRNESSACRSRLHCFSKLARDRSHAREVHAWCRLVVRRRRTRGERERERKSLRSCSPRFLSRSLASSRDRCYLATRILIRAREKVTGSSRSRSEKRECSFLGVIDRSRSFDSR